jgi:hypothetical protein
MEVQAIQELRRGSLRRMGSYGCAAHDRSFARRWGKAHHRDFARWCGCAGDRFARGYEWARDHGRRELMMSSSNHRTDLRHGSGTPPMNASHHRGRSMDMVRPGIACWNRFSESTEQVERHVESQLDWGGRTRGGGRPRLHAGH